MKELTQQHFTGERALYAAQSLRVTDSVFDDGESPLKEGRDLSLDNCLFGWKYPLWYCRNVTVENCHWLEMARAGVWYTRDMRVTNAVIQAPKNFRRCEGLRLENVSLTRADETLWSCKDVQLQRVTAKGDYFAMNSQDLTVDGLMLDGNYSFDGVKNAVIRNSRLLTKDAFWNSENVTVYDSFLSGEYLGWNAKNSCWSTAPSRACRVCATSRAWFWRTASSSTRILPLSILTFRRTLPRRSTACSTPAPGRCALPPSGN